MLVKLGYLWAAGILHDVPEIDMSDLVGEDAGQLGLILHGENGTACDEDVAAGSRKGVDR